MTGGIDLEFLTKFSQGALGNVEKASRKYLRHAHSSGTAVFGGASSSLWRPLVTAKVPWVSELTNGSIWAMLCSAFYATRVNEFAKGTQASQLTTTRYKIDVYLSRGPFYYLRTHFFFLIWKRVQAGIGEPFPRFISTSFDTNFRWKTALLVDIELVGNRRLCTDPQIVEGRRAVSVTAGCMFVPLLITKSDEWLLGMTGGESASVYLSSWPIYSFWRTKLGGDSRTYLVRSDALLWSKLTNGPLIVDDCPGYWYWWVLCYFCPLNVHN